LISRPNGIASTTSTIAWQRSSATSRSDRPSSIATRLMGVTRIRSTTPSRSSSHSPKPTKAELNSAVMTRMPGTKTLKAPPGGKPGMLAMFFNSGPKSSRYKMGCSSPMISQTGLRKVSVTER
jgi:hypothetical protein